MSRIITSMRIHLQTNESKSNTADFMRTFFIGFSKLYATTSHISIALNLPFQFKGKAKGTLFEFPTSILSSLLFVSATETCHDLPFLPNQSRWVSLKLVGKNFMAQSMMRKTWFDVKWSITSLFAASWWAARRMWAFHSSSLGMVDSTSCLSSSSWSLPLH